MKLVSPANIMGSDNKFLLKGRSFLYIMKNTSLGIDSWATPCFNVPQSEKKFWIALGDFITSFCFLLVKQDLNQSAFIPQFP